MKDGFIIRKPEKIHSRSRARASAEAKAKGRHTGYGACFPHDGGGEIGGHCWAYMKPLGLCEGV